MILGTITSTNANGILLKIDGEDTATTKRYTFLSPYYPTANDRVLVEEVGDQYVILGKIVTARADGGRAQYATTAGSASSATNATVAGTVTHVHNWIQTTTPTTSTDAGIQFRTDVQNVFSASKVQWRAVSGSSYGSWKDL